MSNDFSNNSGNSREFMRNLNIDSIGNIPILGKKKERVYQQPVRPTIAKLGAPPEGQPWPTHVELGGVLFMLIPPDTFESAANLAFNRGFQYAVNLYADQITNPVVSNQASYVDMVRAKCFEDRGDSEDGK